MIDPIWLLVFSLIATATLSTGLIFRSIGKNKKAEGKTNGFLIASYILITVAILGLLGDGVVVIVDISLLAVILAPALIGVLFIVCFAGGLSNVVTGRLEKDRAKVGTGWALLIVCILITLIFVALLIWFLAAIAHM